MNRLFRQLLVKILLLVMLTACNMPFSSDESPGADDDSADAPAGSSPGKSASEDETPPPDTGVVASTALPLIAVQTVSDGSIRVVDPNTGQATLLLDAAPPLTIPRYVTQAVSTEGVIYAMSGTPQHLVAVSQDGIQDLGFAPVASGPSFALWPGIDDQPALIAWGMTTSETDRRILQVRAGALAGSGEINTLAERDAENDEYLMPVRWSLDGRRLYISREPGLAVLDDTEYVGFSTLSVIDLGSGEERELIPPTLFRLPTCLDDITLNERLVSYHCNGVGVVELKTRQNTPIFPPETDQPADVMGGVRFNPAGTRLAFAMAYSTPPNEQSWIAITDDLSGRSRLLVTGELGRKLVVLRWLDAEHLLFQSAGFDGSAPELWLAQVDGSAPVKIAEGRLLTVLNPQATLAAGQGETAGGGETSGGPSDEPTPLPTPDPPTVGAVFFETDFRYFPALEQDNGSGATASGGYQIDLQSNYMWAFTADSRSATFYAVIEATPQVCPMAQGYYGLLFHYRDLTNHRAFTVSCSGRYRLIERAGSNTVTQLAEGQLPDLIEPGSGPHRISVLALGSTLTLYVDDYKIDSLTVGQMPVGDIGPYVETTGNPLSVLFRLLQVFEPE